MISKTIEILNGIFGGTYTIPSIIVFVLMCWSLIATLLLVPYILAIKENRIQVRMKSCNTCPHRTKYEETHDNFGHKLEERKAI